MLISNELVEMHLNSRNKIRKKNVNAHSQWIGVEKDFKVVELHTICCN